MKSTGIVRPLDSLGRVVLPIELRRMLELDTKDPVEIYVDGERIVLQKYEPGCTFCGNIEHMIWFNGKRICANCRVEIGGLPQK